MRDRVAGEVDHGPRLGHEPADADDGTDAVEQVSTCVGGSAVPGPTSTSSAVTSAWELSAIRDADRLSAAQTAELIGASRMTAPRDLEYLADAGLVDRTPRYGTAGRPGLQYRWPATGPAGKTR